MNAMKNLMNVYRTRTKNKVSLDLYRNYYLLSSQIIIDMLNYYKKEKNNNIAIWGAGLKGLAFLKTIDPAGKYISYVYDIDEKKEGNVLLTGHKVVNYKKNENKNIQVVLLMNNNYETEVACLLKEADMNVILINIDSVIDGALTVEDILRTQNNSRKIELRSIYDSVAAMVILYNCGTNCIKNIESYDNQVKQVFVYDNSTVKNEKLIQLLKEKKNIVYINGDGNQGISIAINKVAEEAIRCNFQWLITFDQDSVAEKDMVAHMCNYVNRCEFADKLGIVCAAINDSVFRFEIAATEISYNKWVQQSGSMLNLKVFQKIGGFDEALFIDQVDFEYCVRLKQYDYKIVKVNKAILMHNTSDDNTIFLRKRGRPLYINKYSPMRYYYNTRNILYCTKKYKKVNKQYWESQRRNLGSLLMTLPYEKGKIKRVRAVILGYIDYIFDNMGKTQRHF